MKLFKAIAAAYRWVTADNERLRRAKAGLDPRIEPPRQAAAPKKFDPWEEIDRYRSKLWLGRWLNDRIHRN